MTTAPDPAEREPQGRADALLARLSRPMALIDAFQHADGPPPRTLYAFFLWCLRGAMPVLWVAAVLSALAGTLEVISALILGVVIDRALASDAGSFFADNAPMLLGSAAFFMLARPLAFGASAAANAIVVQPNVNPLVLSRLHRWTMGQAVRFFDDDFAGRIAQKQMQAARAVTEITAEFINVVCFALASLVGSVALLGGHRRLGGAPARAVARGLPRADPLVHAAGPGPLGRARGLARDGLGPGRGHHHQHQDRQALRPRRARGPRRARRDADLPRAGRGVRLARQRIPALADDRGGASCRCC